MMETHSFTNQLLIAMPRLNDPNFNRTVSYVCEHNADGAVAIIINKPTDYNLAFIFEQMHIPVSHPAANQMPVMFGGPVQPDRGFVIHQPAGTWRSSLHVSDDIVVTTSHDILEAIAKGEGPSEFLVALGYAGWSPLQLEAEVASNYWLNCTLDIDVLFHTPAHLRWEFAARSMGIDIHQLGDASGHA